MVPCFPFAQSGRAVQAWRGDKDGAGSPRMFRHRSGGFFAAKKLRYSFYPASVRLSRSHRLVPMRALCWVILTTFMPLSPCHDVFRTRKHAARLGRRGTHTRFTQDLDLPGLVPESFMISIHRTSKSSGVSCDVASTGRRILYIEECYCASYNHGYRKVHAELSGFPGFTGPFAPRH